MNRACIRWGSRLAAVLAWTLASPVLSADPAWTDWALNCQGCHRADGSGSPGGAPPLHGVGTFLRLPGGRDYLARVPGVLGAPLGDAAVARLLNWMLQRYDPTGVPTGHTPYTASEIARYRRSPLGIDARARRRQLLAGATRLNPLKALSH
ncbi:MAG: cytochrome [Bradyrhizobium sp.]|nr:cytochrome [Bradyrhizobium sp.]